MATKRDKRAIYEQKAITSSISAKVKLTMKINDNYISVEGNEERTVPDTTGVNMDKEWRFLWDNVYDVCDAELAKILKEMGYNR